MNLNEIALRVAKDMGYLEDDAILMDALPEYAHRLLAEVAKESEPVAWMMEGTSLIERHKFHDDCRPLYIHPAIPALLPDEVREMVERLRDVPGSLWKCYRRMSEAADLIERLAAAPKP